MLEVYIYSILILILFTPFGLFLIQDFKPNIYYFSKQLIFASIIICFLGITINFFLPLNQIVSSSLIIFSLIFIIKNKNQYFNKKFFLFLAIQSLLITLLVTESNVFRPDAGLYHLPFIGMLNSERIIIGLSNLHSRYGHISILQYYSAISNNFILGKNGIVFPQAIIAASIIMNFAYQIYSYIKKKKYNFHFLFLIFIFIYISYKMNRYSEYGNDAPAHFLLFFLISEILLYKNKINYKEFGNNLILSLFIVQNKLTLIFIILLNLLNIKKINFKLLLKDKRFIFVSLFFSIWILKNILSTGCMLFPIKITCYEKLSWTNIGEIEQTSKGSEVWTKDWSNLKINTDISQDDFLKNFNWLEIWLKNHFKIIIKILAPYLFICLIFIFFLVLKNKTKKYIIDKDYIYYFIILLFCSLIWFLKSPLYRYGYSFLISLFSFCFAFYCSRFNYIQKKDIKVFSFILILGFSVIITKNLIRINKTNNEYNNYPWPKYYSMDNKNILVDFDEKKINNTSIFIPINGYCMYVKKICSHYDVQNDLEIKKKYGYYIMNK
tara:strand:- start:7100 stop:8752 length:1653 start_codon:yes stop_codon:yes gene_type:complete